MILFLGIGLLGAGFFIGFFSGRLVEMRNTIKTLVKWSADFKEIEKKIQKLELASPCDFGQEEVKNAS